MERKRGENDDRVVPIHLISASLKYRLVRLYASFAYFKACTSYISYNIKQEYYEEKPNLTLIL